MKKVEITLKVTIFANDQFDAQAFGNRIKDEMIGDYCTVGFDPEIKTVEVVSVGTAED